MDIRTKAILTAVHFSKWESRKKDKAVTNKVYAQHGTAEGSGDWLKDRFPRKSATQASEGYDTFPELTKVLSTMGSLYQWHMENTLEWEPKRRRLLPACSAEEHRAKVDGFIDGLPTMLADMRTGYPAAIERAKVKLNGTFKESDYLPIDELCKRFSVSREYDPIPAIVAPGTLPTGIESMLNEQIETRVEASIKTSMSDAWDRLYTCVQHLQERLAKPGAIFRDTLVTNVQECCEVLKKLNILGDENLENMRTTVASQLAVLNPETLRDNEQYRAQIAAAAGNVLASIRGVRTIEVVED